MQAAAVPVGAAGPLRPALRGRGRIDELTRFKVNDPLPPLSATRTGVPRSGATVEIVDLPR